MNCACDATPVNCSDGQDLGYNGTPVVAWQIGDFGVNTALGGGYNPNEQLVADLIKEDNAGLVLTSGDNDYVGDYQTSVGAPYGLWVSRERFWPVPGNHDWDYTTITPYYLPPDTLDGYLTYFHYLDGVRRYYDKRFGPAHFFFLDSGYDTSGNMLEPDGNTAGTFDTMDQPVGGSIQWRWLVERVRASTAPWKIALAHHPDLTSGNNHGPYPALAWPWSRMGIALRIAGHEHSYERLQKDKTTHIVNGAGGQSLTGFGTISPYSITRYNAMHGALRLEITPETVSGTFVDQTGGIQDSFTLTK